MMTDKIDFPLFVTVWNQMQHQTTPRVHYRIANWLMDRYTAQDTHILLMAFRGCGKSTLLGLFCAWLLTQNPALRILVVSADDMLAERMVRNVRRIIERHPLTADLIPSSPDQWASDRFTVERDSELRDPTMLARGLYGNLTGTRADIIICDDVEVPNTADTAEKRAMLRARLQELAYIQVPGGMTLYAGTPHTFDTIYETTTRQDVAGHTPFLKGYKALKIPVVNKTGVSVWPERFSEETLEKLRDATGPLRFRSQMMLEPVHLKTQILDVTQIQVYDDDVVESVELRALFIGERRLVSASAWWDPALGRGTGDNSVVASVYTDDRGHLWVHDVTYLSVDAQDDESEAVQQARMVARTLKPLKIPVIGVEINGIGRLLPAILRQEMVKARAGASVIEHSARVAKDERIMHAFAAPMAAKMLHIRRNIMNGPFADELRDFVPGARGNRDDGLDAVAGAILMEPMRLPGGGGTIARPLWRQGQTFHAKTN
jgi:hypothetical protein